MRLKYQLIISDFHVDSNLFIRFLLEKSKPADVLFNVHHTQNTCVHIYDQFMEMEFKK